MSDYGMRGKRRRGVPFGLIALVVGTPLLVGTAAVSWLLQRQHAIEEAKAWDIAGPPCPTLTLAQYQAGPQHPFESFTYEGIGFSRLYGHVSCNAVVNSGGTGFGTFPECQFTSADIIRITTPRGDVYYSTGSRPATVAVRQSQPSCASSTATSPASSPPRRTLPSAPAGVSGTRASRRGRGRSSWRTPSGGRRRRAPPSGSRPGGPSGGDTLRD